MGAGTHAPDREVYLSAKSWNNFKQVDIKHHEVLLRKGSGQCQVVQDEGNAEGHFSVFVSVSFSLYTNF